MLDVFCTLSFAQLEIVASAILTAGAHKNLNEL